MERERLGSRLGFIFLSAGCAIGCGNIWKFPWMCGQNGGGCFLVIYLICLMLLGLPVLIMEFALGRAAQASPVRMYHKLERPGTKWHLHGYLALAGNVCLMAFYTVVTGWMICYFIRFLTGRNHEVGFADMITDPAVNVFYLAIAVFVGFFILSFNLQSGLERATKILMPILLILIIVLVLRGLFMPGAGEGLSFYLVPDFKDLHPQVIVSAMNQAFFTLGLGIGSMAIFGSYIGKEHSLMSESVNVIALDSFVAIFAGLIIFPACFTYDLEVTAGPSLLFDTMATVFNDMTGGRLWGTLFFLFMTFAAFSTELAVFENILACVREMTGWSRKKGSLICGIGIFLISLTTALGYSVIHFRPFGEGSAWLDLWDFLVSTNLLPIGSLVFALFCCSSRWGWGWDNFLAEANTGKGLKVRNWMRPVFNYFVPIAIIVIYIVGLATYNWG